MSERDPAFEPEWRLSTRSAVTGLALVVLALQPLSEALLPLSMRVQARGYTLLIFGCLALCWLVGRWQPRVGAWLVVALQMALVGLAFGWLRMPALLTLLALPTAQAAALIGLRAALVTGLGGSVLVGLLPRLPGLPVGGAASAVALAAIWGSLATIATAYAPVRRLSQWSWERYRTAQSVLEDARSRTAELKQALDDLAHANRQLALANERMAGLRSIAEEAQRAKAAFVAKVSHEFRTPLNMIIGLVDLMAANPEIYGQDLGPAMAEDLEIVRRNCEHLTTMVNDVLALSQAEAGRLTLRREQVALGTIVEAAVTVVRPLLEKKKLSLQVAIPPSLPSIYCDPVRIRQVILNLLSNAARFTEAGGITIQVREEEQWIVVRVSDTGPGISSADLERIFEPFSQGAGSLHDRSGTGLGLTVSKQFVESHGGRIWVESELGAGACFAFTLPVALPPEHFAGPGRWISESWAWVERRSRPEADTAPSRPRIILCDEGGDLCPALGPFADEIEVIDTGGLDEACREAARCPAQAIVVNAALPERLWPLLEKAREQVHDTPVIGWAVPPSTRAQQAGARGYLTKPVTRAALEEAIRATGRPVRRVLAVDDDPDVSKLWAMMLETFDAGLEVATAASGEEALASLRSHPADLVLLDIYMPGLDGWQVLALKAQEPAIRDIPVILVSAQDPREQPPASPVLLATMGGGLELGRLLHCSLEVAALLLKPD